MKRSFETDKEFSKQYGSTLDLSPEDILSGFNEYKINKRPASSSANKRAGSEAEKLDQFFEEVQRLLIRLRKTSQASFLDTDTGFIDMLYQLFEERKIFREMLLANSARASRAKLDHEFDEFYHQNLQIQTAKMKHPLFNELKDFSIRRLEDKIHELKLTFAFMVIFGNKVLSILHFQDVNSLKEKFEERKLNFDDVTLEKILTEIRNANSYHNNLPTFQDLKEIVPYSSDAYLKIDNLLKFRPGHFNDQENIGLNKGYLSQENLSLGSKPGSKQHKGSNATKNSKLKENLVLNNTKAQINRKLNKTSKGNKSESHEESFEKVLLKQRNPKENYSLVGSNRKVVSLKSNVENAKCRQPRRRSPYKSWETSRIHYNPRSLDMIKEVDLKTQQSMRECRNLQHRSPQSDVSSKRDSLKNSPSIDTRKRSLCCLGFDSERAHFYSNKVQNDPLPARRTLHASNLENSIRDYVDPSDLTSAGNFETAQFRLPTEKEYTKGNPIASANSRQSDSDTQQPQKGHLTPIANSPTVRRLDFSNIKNNSPDTSSPENNLGLTFTVQDQARIGSFSGPVDKTALQKDVPDSHELNSSIKNENEISSENQKLFKVFFQKDLKTSGSLVRETNVVKLRVDCNRSKTSGLNSSKYNSSGDLLERNDSKTLQSKSKSNNNFKLEPGKTIDNLMGGCLIKGLPSSPEFCSQLVSSVTQRQISSNHSNYSTGGRNLSSTANNYSSERHASSNSSVLNMYFKKYQPKYGEGEIKPILPKKSNSRI